jgi:hypothetical protein
MNLYSDARIHEYQVYTQPTLQDPTGYTDNDLGHPTSLGDYKADIQVVYLPSNITPVMQLTDEV